MKVIMNMKLIRLVSALCVALCLASTAVKVSAAPTANMEYSAQCYAYIDMMNGANAQADWIANMINTTNWNMNDPIDVASWEAWTDELGQWMSDAYVYQTLAEWECFPY